MPGLDSVFSGSYIKSSTNGSGYRLVDTFAPTTISALNDPAKLNATVAASRGLPYYRNYANAASYAKTDPAWNVANTTTYQLSDSVSVKNIIGYRKYKTENFDDQDGSSLGLIEYGNKVSGTEFSEEFQVAGQAKELNWILGAYYERENVSETALDTALASPVLYGVITPDTISGRDRNSTRSIFGSATQKLDNIANGLSLTLGGRYTWDRRETKFGTIYAFGLPGQTCAFDASVTNAAGNPYDFDAVNCRVNRSASFQKFTYSASLDWKVSRDLLVYFANRKGYRAGGFGTLATNASQLSPFRPDSVVDFELGAKYSTTFDNGMYLKTNLALYKSNYRDIQRLVPFQFGNGTVGTNIANAGKAVIKGVEFESEFRPTKALSISGYLSYTDPVYKVFNVLGPVPQVGCTAAICNVAAVAQFSGVPKWQYGITGRVTVPTSKRFGELVAQINWYHQSSFSDQDRPIGQAAGVIAGYGLMGGRIEVNNIAGSQLSGALFVTNLLDHKYQQFRFALATELGFVSSVAGAPRMVGFELRYNFGH